NGSGKTTTMSMLLGLVKPTSGTFKLLDGDRDGPTLYALRRIGATVEAPAFYPYLSGLANLKYIQGISHKGRPADIQRLLELVGLTARAGSKFRTYSLGMKQRLGIAYALLSDPELLVLDEPTNGLDPAGMAEVRELMGSLGNGGHTVLLSSHLLHEVEQVCHNIAILSRGRLIAQGPVSELVRQKGALRVHTTDDARAASVIKSSLPWVADVASRDGHLAVTAPPDRAWELTAALAVERIFVSEMVPIQTSLEDYFLELTGGDALPLEEQK
ncbi:MAG: ABC transporter ATP-binding protein, partial [Chloroflexi bacterium]|nr:ABC transporter ATP-binding protein [Chloroflexota bacterium]